MVRRSLPTLRLPTLVLVGAAAWLVCGRARADDFGTLERGKNSYEGDRIDECIDRFSTMLTPGDPVALKDPDIKNRARMYLAACLIAKGREPDADKQIQQIILDDTRFSPDRAAFPIKVLDRFSDIRARLKEEIDRLDRERNAAEEVERKRKEEEKRKEATRAALLERLAREEIHVKENSRWVAALPFGAGQFQNGQKIAGWSLLGTEAALAAASIVFFVAKSSIESQVSADPGKFDLNDATRRRDEYVLLNRISFASFAAVAVGGILHAQLTFVPEVREVEERKLPAELTVSADANAAGATLHLGAKF